MPVAFRLRWLGRWLPGSALLLIACSDHPGPLAPAGPGPDYLYSQEFYGSCDPSADPDCSPHALTASQRYQIQQALGGLTCSDLKSLLQEKLDSGQIMTYDSDDGNWADSHLKSGNIHIWVGTYGSGRLGETLAHEAAHLQNRTTDETVANQAEVDCGQRTAS